MKRHTGILCRRLWTFTAVVLVAVIADSWMPSIARADSITLEDGTVIDKVSFLSVTWETIEYRARRQKSKVSGSDVATIERDSEYLRDARALFARSDYEGTITEIKVLDPGSKTDPWEEAEAAYLLGEALYKKGDAEKAAEAFKAYLDAHRDSKDWWVPQATSRLGELALSRKQWGTAGVYYEALAAYGEKWQDRAEMGQGRAALGTGKAGTQKARILFLGVARRTKDPALKQEAQAERIRAILIAEQYKTAVDELNEGFFDAASGRLSYGYARARATLLMGQALAGLGGTENLEKAELWLLKVDALYGQHTDIYAQACDDLVDVYTKLGKADRAEAWKKRKTGA